MARALVLDGCDPRVTGAVAAHAVSVTLERHGWEVDVRPLWQMEIAPCAGCFGCWLRTPGICLIDDAARDLARAYVGSDLAALVTPILFGGYGFHLKKAIDRLIGVISPLFTVVHGETHHRPRYRRYPAILGVGLLPRPDPEAASVFRRLVERNAINKCAPRHAAVTLEQGWDAERSIAALDEALARLEGAR